MMQGYVQNRHALLPVTFRLPGRPDLVIEFVVDTGFTGELTLSLQAVAALQLFYATEQPSRLADDSKILIPVYFATIVWKGIEQQVSVLATGRRPLLGTSLLDGSELVSQFVENGLVIVDDL